MGIIHDRSQERAQFHDKGLKGASKRISQIYRDINGSLIIRLLIIVNNCNRDRNQLPHILIPNHNLLYISSVNLLAWLIHRRCQKPSITTVL